MLSIDCGRGYRCYAALAAAAFLQLLLPLENLILLGKVVAACSSSRDSSGIECGIVERKVRVGVSLLALRAHLSVGFLTMSSSLEAAPVVM